MRWLTHPTLVRACQIVIGVLFAWAALSKLGDLEAFATQLHNFRIVPIPTENLLALTLPWIELMAALALVLNVQPRAGGAVAVGLLAVFSLAVLAAMVRGLDIECGCFGTSDASRTDLPKLLQNGGMLLLAGIATLRPR